MTDLSIAALPAARLAPRKAKRLVRIVDADLYVDYRAVLRSVHWELRAGEHWAIFGANGAGKSSFLKLLYGDLAPALGGSIERVGFPRGTPISAWKRRVGLVSPELQTDYRIDVTILELVASGRYASVGLCEAPTVADERRARRWLRFFLCSQLPDVGHTNFPTVSCAVPCSRALASKARILLLDEPLTGLDPRQRAAMKRLLERLMTHRLTLVVAVHHREDLPRGMTHALNLHNQTATSVELNSET